MDLDPNTAMAVAAWKRYDDAVSDDLTRAVAGAFALIACADGELAEEEVEQFVIVSREQEAFHALDAQALEGAFRNLCESIFTDLDEGKRRALEDIARVKGDENLARLVVSAARIATLADSKLKKIEQVALMLIAKTLGVELDD